MCELLGMSANIPTDICFSFRGLAKRGGATGPHVDGWGMAFYEGKGCRTFKDPKPCSFSPIASMLEDYPIKSQLVIAHIRQANRGKIALENTHPFTRQLWGRNWTFAHNGQLSDYKKLDLGNFEPIGQTDSEYAFCYILNKLQQRYPNKPKNWPTIFRFVKSCADELRMRGIVNLLFSDGRYLFVYCSTHLHWITRQSPFGKAKLIDEDMEIDFAQHTTPNDIVTVVATNPLTSNENWQKMQSGTASLFKSGEQIF
ncbi:glutamine amidotransferase [Orbus hercynius]|uniref:Glutamine amidotransferase n=1 Tax=Orbus hercynius TaxID=593135 RepID=A0A495RBK2_9GAMM|nr:class II glutamine amidotransferase [Orbus hercynius]RKS84711.1 glutamine amidotransferase [Orbus hercynius]